MKFILLLTLSLVSVTSFADSKEGQTTNANSCEREAKGLKISAHAIEQQGDIVQFLYPKVTFFGRKMRILAYTKNSKIFCKSLGMKFHYANTMRSEYNDLVADLTNDFQVETGSHGEINVFEVLSCKK
jgi:hypothetical protein